MEPGFMKRLVNVLRAVYHMVRRGLCRKRLMMDLHLLLGRGKLAGKALRNLVAAANHHHHPHGAAAAGHIMVPSSSSGAAAGTDAASSSALSFCSVVDPRDEVEFSCTTTPSYKPPTRAALFPLFRIRGGRRRCGGGLDVAEVARAFEMMNAQEAVAGSSGGAETPSSSVAGVTPSPMLALSLGRSPAGVRQLRVTDSPFPVEPEGVDERVDAEADNFIKRFYERLRLEQAFATPDNTVRRRGA